MCCRVPKFFVVSFNVKGRVAILEEVEKATIKELEETCAETIETFLMCQGMALTKIAEARVDMLCELVKQDLITTENAIKMWKNYSGPPLWNEAVNRTLKQHLKCPLKLNWSVPFSRN